MSPRRLGLQILCKSKTPIEHIMNFWPTLPLVVQYRNSKPKSLSRNIVAALRHPDRVCKIELDVTGSTIGSIVELIQEPFLSLERIQITSKDATRLPVLTAFLGGSAPRLVEIVLWGVAIPFPALRRLLLSTNNLINLELWNILNTCYFPPDALVTCLPALAHLKFLRVGFAFPAPRPSSSWAHLPLERPTLPSLLFFKFRGTSEYLEGVVARIDFPYLATFSMNFFNKLVFEVPQLCRFIPRAGKLQPFSDAVIYIYEDYIRVTLMRRGERKRTIGECCLGIRCKQLDWQLSFMTQIFSQLSLLLSNVKTLAIEGSSLPPTGQEDMDPTQWLDLLQPFTNMRQIRVVEGLVPGIVQALATEDMAAGILPSLSSLHLKGFRQSLSLVEAAERFVTLRKLSGRSINLYS